MPSRGALSPAVRPPPDNAISGLSSARLPGAHSPRGFSTLSDAWRLTRSPSLPATPRPAPGNGCRDALTSGSSVSTAAPRLGTYCSAQLLSRAPPSLLASPHPTPRNAQSDILGAPLSPVLSPRPTPRNTHPEPLHAQPSLVKSMRPTPQNAHREPLATSLDRTGFSICAGVSDSRPAATAAKGSDAVIDSIPHRSIASAGYQIIGELAKGSQSIVRIARDSANAERCIKCINKKTMDARVDDPASEYEMMSNIGSHPCVAMVLDIFQDARFYFLVYEHFEGGDFTTVTERAAQAGVNTTEDWWRTLFFPCILGLIHLHKHEIIHCDIKESNLMLRRSDYSRPEAVIIDLGIAQTASADRGLKIGTPGYMPPEVWTTQRWLVQGDVFSMGVVILQMMLHCIPEHHRQLPPDESMKGVFLEHCCSVTGVARATRFREAPIHLLPILDVARLCHAMLQKDWRSRPTARKVLDDVWFDGPVFLPQSQVLCNDSESSCAADNTSTTDTLSALPMPATEAAPSPRLHMPASAPMPRFPDRPEPRILFPERHLKYSSGGCRAAARHAPRSTTGGQSSSSSGSSGAPRQLHIGPHDVGCH